MNIKEALASYTAPMTSHRAAGRARGTTGWMIAGGVVLVVILGSALALLLRPSSSEPEAAGRAPTPTTTPSPSASPTAPPASASAAPTKKASPRPALARVAATAPHEISIGSLVRAGFSTSLGTVHRHLIPDRPDKLQRVAARGLPGSPGTDTVILVGAANDRGTGALDDLDKIHVGDLITLTTQNATLTYRVDSLREASPDDVLALSQVRARDTGRLVIDRARYVRGNRTGSDLVVIAQLVQAESIRP